MNPVDFIHDKTNLAKHITNALGYAQPMILPFGNLIVLPKKYADDISNPAAESRYNEGLSNLGDNFFQCPLSFDIDGEQWRLPVDPLISVNGKNVIKRRYVSKAGKDGRRGSVKECWSQDDYDITIAGVLIAEDNASLIEMLNNLQKVCQKAEAVSVYCEFLNNANTFGIQKIAIESYDFPFTKGMENQSFTIKAYSDDSYELLEEINN